MTQGRFSPRPFLLDAALALAILGVSLFAFFATGAAPSDARLPLAVILLVLQSVPVLWRRSAPVLVLAVVGGAFVFYASLDLQFNSPYAGPIALYSVAAYTPTRTSAAAGALGAAAILGGTAIEMNDGRSSAFDVASLALVMGIAWVIGARVRRSRVHAAELAGRAAHLERDREERARAAVAAERARIARELHDVVAHNVSIMVVQAGGARRVLDERPDAARGALASIEQAGRSALAELRRLLGVMREDDAGGALEPPPGVASLDRVLEQVRDAGVPVEMIAEGDARPLPPGVDMSVHRIVQESLTNVLKHAGRARATVRLRYEPNEIDVEVTDDGVGATAAASNGRGHGLIGMRERVALFGGDFHAGPRREGGFTVRARLPLGGEPS